MSEQGPGEVLFAFVRHWSRRSDPPTIEQGQLVLVTEAVHALATRGEETTVNAVAEEIGLDQSGASRLVARAMEAGYLSRRVSATDARRRTVGITAAGETMLNQAHAWQEKLFAQLTADWSLDRRHAFRQAMVDLMQRSRDAATQHTTPVDG